MAFKYDHVEKKREAILRAVHEHQPVSVRRLHELLPMYGHDAIKKEMVVFFREGLVTKQRASKYDEPRTTGTGFFYSIPPTQEVQP